MAHRLSLADVEPYLHILRDGRGWDAYVAAVNQARPGAPPASERTIRRVMRQHGLQAEKYPAAPHKNLGGRPRKPELDDTEFKIATEAAEQHPGKPDVAYGAAAAAVTAHRIKAGGGGTVEELRRLRVGRTWMRGALAARGWRPPARTPSGSPAPVGPRLLEAVA